MTIHIRIRIVLSLGYFKISQRIKEWISKTKGCAKEQDQTKDLVLTACTCQNKIQRTKDRAVAAKYLKIWSHTRSGRLTYPVGYVCVFNLTR
ncbi:unnamed protein product [Cuscuta epithymum]|uniref:Uncharacterized protein n=1 Tax=Cuscuta epithymum TaxID=186058 RepID=A0AAV0FRZ2_9ASTE|nr:unnamed protein product [Cuscuta epithymum]